MRTRIILAATFLITILWITYLATKIDYWYVLNYVIWRPRVKTIEVKISGGSKTIFLKKYSRSLNREVRVISISGSKFLDPDDKVDFIQSTILHVFYEVHGDTLALFLRHPFKTPAKLPAGFVVQQHVLENPDYMNYYDKQRSSPETIGIF